MENYLTDIDFQKISRLIYSVCGIYLPESKQILVEGRIRKRMKALCIDEYKVYAEYLFSKDGYDNELVHLIDVITTNKTDFFREPVHFDYIKNAALPELIKDSGVNGISAWSAGCSTGEEPYTLAIVLEEYLAALSIPYFIFASDISINVLKKAESAIYDAELVDVISLELKKKYLLKSIDENKKIVKIAPKLRSRVDFRRINFMDEIYDVPDNLDIVMCRNVIIYFDKETQFKVLQKIAEKIRKGGYLFIGHSETLMNMKLPLKRMASTIYMKV